MPDAVYEQYLENPKNFILLSAFRRYKAEREKEELEKNKGKGNKLG